MNPQTPLPYRIAARSELDCIARTAVLLVQHRIHLRQDHSGLQLHFANGTSAPVYQETVVDSGTAEDPCVLIVEFRLRGMHGWLHTIFRWESMLNTPLFVGFPGFVSKLWLANDEQEVYRGVYEWNGPQRAEHYARCLWRLLALGSVSGSIHYAVLPGMHRDALLSNPHLLDAGSHGQRVSRSIRGVDRCST